MSLAKITSAFTFKAFQLYRFFAKIRSGRDEGLILSSEAVQEVVSEEGWGCSVTANRYEDTAGLVADSWRAHLFQSSLYTPR